MDEVVDAELKAIHDAAMSIYRREEAVQTANPASVHSITATKFLAKQAQLMADSALLLMADARQPLNVPFALFQTCVEAQARAIHIITATGAKREAFAGEFVKLIQIRHEYYTKCATQLEKDRTFAESQPCDRQDFDVMKSYLRRTDTSNLAKIRKLYDKISFKWNYDAVTKQDQLPGPASLNHLVAPPLQLELHLAYLRSFSFMHSDPAALKRLVNPVILAHKLVLAEVISITCFFAALGKEDDQDLINIKMRAFRFDVNKKNASK